MSKFYYPNIFSFSFNVRWTGRLFFIKNSGVIKSKLKLNIQAEYLKILKVNKKKLFHPVVWINFWRYEAKSGKKIQRPIIHWNEFGLQVSNRNGRIFLAGKKPTINAFEPKADLQGVFNLANLSIQTWLPLKRYVMRT